MLVIWSLLSNYIFHLVGRFSDAMTTRKLMLTQAMDGLVHSGVPLIESIPPQYGAAGMTDDIGIYYWVPKLAYWFNIDLDSAYNLLGASLFSASFLMALLGVFLFFNRAMTRVSGIVMVIILYFIWLPLVLHKIELNYLVSLISILSFVPLTLYFTKKGNHTVFFVMFLFLAGIVIGNFHYIRAFSGLSTVIIIVALVMLSPIIKRKQKSQLILSLILGLSVSVMFFNHLKNERDHFLSTQSSPYYHGNIASQHPFWHSVYIALGYYPDNPFGVTAYSDTVGDRDAKAVDPSVNYLSLEYNSILRHLYFKKITEHPQFYVIQILRKASRIFCQTPFTALALIGFLIALAVGIMSLRDSYIMQVNQLDKKYIINLNGVLLLGWGASLLPAVLVVPSSRYAADFYAIGYIYMFFGLIILWQLVQLNFRQIIGDFKKDSLIEAYTGNREGNFGVE